MADCRTPKKSMIRTFSDAFACELCAPCFSIGSAQYYYQRLSRLAPHRSRSLGSFAICPTAPSSGWAPLGRGSDGRFGLRRFRAKLTPTPFGTHRAFTHALPPSLGLRSVPFTVPPCFFPPPLK